MNKFTLFAFALLLSLGSFGQSDIVNWKFESRKLSANKHEVKFTAFIKAPWHIYSITQAEGGPTPTKITFTKNPLATPEGNIKELGRLETHYEEVFQIDTKFYSDKVEFVQIVNVKSGAKTNLTGTIRFGACTSTGCMPPEEIPFTVALK